MIAPSTEIPAALDPMAALKQWICWRPVLRKNGKVDKVPTDPATGHDVSAMDPASWMTSDDAKRHAKASSLGIGFILTASDNFFCIDLDNCATKESPSKWNDTATEVLDLFPGAAVEVSASGRGLHIFGSCAREFLHRKRNPSLHAELYTERRFMAIGTGAVGDAGTELSAQLLPWAAEHFPPSAAASTDAADWTTEPLEGYTGPEDDDELIRRAKRGNILDKFPSNDPGVKTKATFENLWERNVDVLADAYPTSDPVKNYNDSAADNALASHLRFWTGADCERMESLMRRSGLAREKWDRPDYLRGTILKICASGGDICDKLPRGSPVAALATAGGDPAATLATGESAATAVPVSTGDSPLVEEFIDGIKITRGKPVMYTDKQMVHFRGCTYVRSVNKIMVPSGDLVDVKQFRATFGGYVFVKSVDEDAKTTTNAYDAFTENQSLGFPWAAALRFEPLNDKRLITDKEVVYANTWRRPLVKRTPGDASPFVNHIRKLLPVGVDADMLLAYLAASVQHQGTKFTWCPIIVGTQGNGKTLIAECIKYAIGEEHVHMARASQLVKEKYNGWLTGNTLIVVEDIRIQNEKSAAMEELKPMITSSSMEIRRMQVEGVTERICCNFILTSNHKDAIPLTDNERRFAVFFCAQQKKPELAQQGFTAAYFDGIYDWLKNQDGYAIVADFLWTYDIPRKRNPATGCMRAPDTSSRKDAINASLPVGSQLIAEAVGAEDVGFRGDWISSRAVTTLLEDRKCRSTPRSQVAYIEALGYHLHPALPDGRSRVGTEGRIKLYVRIGSIPERIKTPVAAADAYVKAQEKPCE